MTVDQLIEAVIEREGGYSFNPADRGGETYKGIARNFNPDWKGWAVVDANKGASDFPARLDSLASLHAAALDFYRQRYYFEPRLDKVNALSQQIASELLDTAINMGAKVAGQFLQQALNAFNAGDRYQVLATDGAIGPATIGALEAFLAWRGSKGEAAMIKALNCLQGARYIGISESRPDQRAFVFGWITNRVTL